MGQKLPKKAAYLVADVGGTNTRIAVGSAGGKLIQLRAFTNDEVDDLLALLTDTANAASNPRYAVFAVAGRKEGDNVRPRRLPPSTATKPKYAARGASGPMPA
ncbi:MAG: hypothetical protein GEU91_14360 [Rhizobiales bacterium]|nr:hypothetical protein [Hyphomicrobiales bacterium]